MASLTMSSPFQDVLEFHKKFNLDIGNIDRPVSLKTITLRENLLYEEYDETVESIEDFRWNTRRDFLEGLRAATAKELCDLIYVAIGTAIELGIDLEPVWEVVHESNMAKEAGNTNEAGKLLKPEGWQYPDVKKVLRQVA